MCVNVVFASDQNYLVHLAVAMYSLFENNRELSLNVYILNTDIDRRSWDKLRSIARRFGQNVIDVKICRHEVSGLVTTYHFTSAAYYRIFIPEKLEVAKALYLDCDIVINGCVKDLYDVDIRDAYLAGVINPGFNRHKQLEMSEESKYFNSGVMLMNLEKWRDDNIKHHVFDIVRRKPEAMLFVDQCGINSVINGRWIQAHPKFNLQACVFDRGMETCSREYPGNELLEAVELPIVIHFSGSVKPWHQRSKHPHRHLYWKYLRKTPFNYYLPKDLTIANLARRFAQRLFPS